VTTPRTTKESAIDAQATELRRRFISGDTLDEAQLFLRAIEGKGARRQDLASFRREALGSTIVGGGSRVVREAFRKGASVDEVQKLPAVRRRRFSTTALKALRRDTAEVQSLRNTPRDAIPRFLKSAKTELRKKFSYVVELRGKSRETGELKIGHVTISTNRGNRTRRSLENQARRFFSRSTERPDPTTVGSGAVTDFILTDAVLLSGLVGL